MKILTQPNSICEFRLPQKSSRFQLPGLLLSLLIACVMISGCGATRLRADYRGYERSYAESSNRQMLLNLARLNQHHPTFFFKMGQISTNYRIQASLPGNAQFSPTGNIGGVTGGGGLGGLYEQDPSFTFIPVNDDAMAQQLVRPVPAEFFYVLYQQGWRVDQLLRLMVDRVEIDVPGRGVHIIRNIPSAEEVDSYVTFLRISAIALELQRRGDLILAGEARFAPVADGWESKDLPTPRDLLDAMSKYDALNKSITWRQVTNKQGNLVWQMGTNKVVPIFKLNLPKENADNKEAVKRIRDQYLADIEKSIPELKGTPLFPPQFPEMARLNSLDTTLQILQCGFKLSEAISPESNPNEGCISARLVMRSLIGMMSAAAQEQARFEALRSNPAYKFDDSRVPKKELQPIIQLIWGGDDQLTAPLIELDYLGKHYSITDPSLDRDPKGALEEKAYWNRDVFRIISQLASQVTVDISKFPLPEILQLRSQ